MSLPLGRVEIQTRYARSAVLLRTYTLSPHGSKQAGITTVAMESTGVYWLPVYEILEARTRDGFALAPGLPLQAEEIVDTGSIRPVQWFFDNLLPKESARAQLINTMTHTRSFDAWYLLSLFGSESAGALSLLPRGTVLGEGGLKPLTNEELERRIQAMPRQPLAANAPKKTSVAGAEQKLLVVVGEDRALFEPVGAFASTHILKPYAASKHYPCSAVNEWCCARLAQKLGLDIPDLELRFVPSPVYIIKRFDRDFSTSPVSRLHALDATQPLNLAAGAKYTKPGVESLIDISEKTRGKLPARIALSPGTCCHSTGSCMGQSLRASVRSDNPRGRPGPGRFRSFELGHARAMAEAEMQKSDTTVVARLLARCRSVAFTSAPTVASLWRFIGSSTAFRSS